MPGVNRELKLFVEPEPSRVDLLTAWIPRIGVALLFLSVGASKFRSGTMWVPLFALGVGALGALFSVATAPLYPFYVRLAAAHGIDLLQDQQIAGLIMWIPAGTIYLVAAGVFFVAWLLSTAYWKFRRYDELYN